MINLRSGAAAIAILGAVAGFNSAHATTVAFDDVGFGNLTGLNTPNVLDNNTAVVSATITQVPGLTVVDSVAETLDGKPFTLSPHGSQVGSGNSYLAGFTFNLTQTSDIAVSPLTDGLSYIVVKDYKTDGGSNGKGAFAPSVSGIGVPVTSYANLAAGKYTLLLEGVVDLAIGQSTTVSAAISAVPLPGSLVMFGSALIGLTAFGARRRVGITA